jgi:class 3 adenylate cyclase/tetratricopeptide (TPR) repeat protein
VVDQGIVLENTGCQKALCRLLGTTRRQRRRLISASSASARPETDRQLPKHAAMTLENALNDKLLERRQLTVLFCDLVGSTAISANLDPEDESTVLRAYHRCCIQRISNAGGFVAQFQGDGVIGYFGYQQASESDAERAIRAALELVESVPKITTGLGTKIKARVGIYTGLVVTGDPERLGTRLEQAVIGETINLAARLQSIANANEIIIADSTRRLIGSLFACRNLGPLVLKGYAEPVQAWQVLRARTTTSQFKTYREPALTPIFGRDAEVDVLLRKWRQTVEGSGQIVSLVGEAGIGKSRLIKEFHQRIARESHTWLEGGGSQFFQYTSFHAISQMILRALNPGGHASAVELRTRLVRALSDAGVDLVEALPLIAEMLGLSSPEPFAALMLAPRDKRDRLFAALADWLYANTRREPLVIVIEDLHWVDPSSLELIGKILNSSRQLPALVLLSMRPGFRAPLFKRNPRRLHLKRLPDDNLRQIIAKVGTDGSSLPEEVVERVVHRADGVPLFAVELIRLVMERNLSAADRQIPATLSDLLTARLDQLGPAKHVAQVAAVIGDEGSLALLRIVSGVAEACLRSHLARLVKSGVLQQSGSEAVPIYSFRHSLLRDAAYEALLKSRRRELHRRTAILLSAHTGTPTATHPEFLAHHWTQAGEPHLAIEAWHRAGDASRARRAFREAQQAYQGALSVISTLPPSSDSDALELALQGSLAEILRITRGYSAPQTVVATTRARVLSEKNGDIAQRFAQSVGAWAAASSGGDYLTARQLADQVLELARADGSRVSLAHAHMIQMTSRYRAGDLVGAEDYFERGQDLFKSPSFLKHPGWAAQTFGNAARNAWIMGDDTRAQWRIDRASTIARENDSPYDMAFAQYMAAVHAVLSGDLALAARRAEDSIHLSDKYGFPQFAAISRIALGRAKAGSGALRHGISLIRDGLSGMAGTNSRVAITLYMTWLAEAQLLGGLLDDSLRSAEQALDINPQELFFRPASLQLRGSLHARKGLSAKAERDFQEAMDLSTHMGAKRLYDRAADSLHQLTTLIQH